MAASNANSELKNNVIIAVCAMPECPACEAYLPRFLEQVYGRQQAGVPYVIHQLGHKLPEDVIPVLLLDATSQDPKVMSFMDRWAIEGTPTTLVILRKGGNIRVTGSVGPKQIEAMLGLAEMHV